MENSARALVPARGPIRGPKRLLALRSDPRLVELVRAGDSAAFEVLYERHVAGVLGFCTHLLGSREEAEDAVQQAFVSAHGSMLRGRREIAFKPWLYTIARNRCLSILRARRERPSELPELSTAGLNEQVEGREDLRQLVADVRRLPEQQRTALVLGELGDLSHVEIAEVIGLEPKAVKGLAFRARAALAERQEARAADCADIRVELAGATGGALRRGRLRYHLEECPDCTAYLAEVRRQRKLLGMALPVVPTMALKDSVMSSVGLGTASAGGLGAAVAGGTTAAGGVAAGGAATAGAPLLAGTLAKVAVVGAIAAGGAGVATEVARDGDAPQRSGAPGVERDRPAGAEAPAPAPGAAAGPASGNSARAGSRGARLKDLARRRAVERSGGRAAAGAPPGLSRRPSEGSPGASRGRSGTAHDRPAATGGRPDPAPAPGSAGPPPATRGPGAGLEAQGPRRGAGVRAPAPRRAPAKPRPESVPQVVPPSEPVVPVPDE